MPESPFEPSGLAPESPCEPTGLPGRLSGDTAKPPAGMWWPVHGRQPRGHQAGDASGHTCWTRWGQVGAGLHGGWRAAQHRRARCQETRRGTARGPPCRRGPGRAAPSARGAVCDTESGDSVQLRAVERLERVTKSTEPEGAPQAQQQRSSPRKRGSRLRAPHRGCPQTPPAPPKAQDGERGPRPALTTWACPAPEMMSQKSRVRSPPASRD